MGSSIRIPYGSAPPLRVRPLSPHSVSPTPTEGCWPVERFPTPVPWVTGENPEGLGWGHPEGEKTQAAGRTELHIWP